MSKFNGGPAFPSGECYELNEGWRREEGMALRDYFAAKAMQGYLTHPRAANSPVDVVANWSYTIADAMLRVRNAK